MINAVIIDDERKAAEVLDIKVRELNQGIHVLTKIQDPDEAIKFLNSNQVDLVFLDIEMPVKSGFDVLKASKNLDFEIIFVTGYQNYAIQAIQFSAIGYVMKPVDDDDLSFAIQQAKLKISEKKSKERNVHLLNNLMATNNNKKIGIPTMYGIEFIRLQDIIRCEGLQKCTKVVNGDGKNIISSYNIGEFHKLLEPYGFFAVHKSHLINMAKIQKYLKEGTIHMDDNSVVPIARRRKQLFLDQLAKV
ncbi:LytR/AlgR family response regulator transcription factor [Portibacter lacus]|uniref:DNA-binding response regulator n=1 Tax=Portibacter lacus TaxID=1099794 RepID=A0AA37SK61_9BACT|nr:LytTR family DNA-binding domain-containing protein [Portibacter lacus]GLR15437.1 DNA-binding response regulator [Portibacter lacus]